MHYPFKIGVSTVGILNEETTLGELSEIALRKSVTLIYDLGAGLLQPLDF